MNSEPTKKRDPEILKQVREQMERLERLEALGQRAVACKGFRWTAGMLGLSNQSSSRSIWIRVVDPPMDDTSECWPDLSDPATVGCLLAMVREAWSAGFHLVPDGGWLARGARLPDGATVNLGVCAPTEVEALVAALEAANGN
jgi:hypothetical protein